MPVEKPRKLPRQERSRLLVARILDATARILVERGYGDLTTNAVAQEAGASVGSLYQYFPNKETLVAALVERHGQRVYRTIMECDPSPPRSLTEAVRQIVHAVGMAHRIDPGLHAVLESEMPRLRTFDGHAATVKAIADRLDAMPAEAKAALKVSSIDQAAKVVGEMVHALIHAALIPPVTTSMNLAEVETETCRAVVAYLSASPSIPSRAPAHTH